ncbi:DUF4383 domain-containing protein [Streptomyces sp. NP160]|uniref:DUF4383 domain-containing protein n=1 Tax=Streptomyces sp. NP160 TaxID=2586637 RepID=UPI0011190F83|nr:DUF4383 domain-containing protein [Streptomyces sp. NP160]TNM68479.1 DUF4383 domain-containing protein [Streptomyces sp. NP160]
MSQSTTTGGRGTNRLVALVFGAVYLLVGLVGFALTGLSGFADPAGGRTLVVFEVNPLHNVVHVAIGAALLLASRRLSAARATNGTIGAVYLLVGVLGLFIASPTSHLNLLALNHADNVLHLASAVLLLGVAVGADRRARVTAAA